MLFYWFDRPSGGFDPPNEAWRLSPLLPAAGLLACAVGGMLYAAALPPLNWSFAAAFALLPVLISVSLKRRWIWNALSGWIWGWCWAIFAYRFLREIEWFVPWLLAPVMGLFPALWAVLLGLLMRAVVFPLSVDSGGIDSRREYLLNGIKLGRLLLLGTTASAGFIVVEYLRSRLFPWNDLAVTMYRHPRLLQLAALTGSSGVGFGVALFNASLWMLCFRRGWRAAAILGGAAILWFVVGALYVMSRPVADGGESVNWKILAIQGDLSQRRHATVNQAAEALDIYEKLTLKALAEHPGADLVVWPESAIPILYYSALDLRHSRLTDSGRIYGRYQDIVYHICTAYRQKLLFGALDLAETLPLRHQNPGVTNSALLADESGNIRARYDKCHRVPFGEFVPGRRFLPESWVDALDMGRDLVPGRVLAPLEWSGEGNRIRPGIVICYEGVFGYLTRELVRRGANVLVALSNDAWYPRSSEPEQHLANATMRAVECAVPMVRVGNNGGTGVVMPDGRFTQVLEVPGTERRPELRRGRGYRLLEVPVYENPRPTLYVRWGEWFPRLLVCFMLCMVLYAFRHRAAVIKEAFKVQLDGPVPGMRAQKSE